MLYELSASGWSLGALDPVDMAFPRTLMHLDFQRALVTSSTRGEGRKRNELENTMLLKLHYL